MGIPQSLEPLVGRWTGTSSLHRSWLQPPSTDTSPSTATVARAVGGKFLAITYDWSLDGASHEGLILLGHKAKGNEVHASWADSWHMSVQPLASAGTIADGGAVDLRGAYAAPPGPDWGWRTVITLRGPSAFELVMYNVTPDGVEEIAVESRYERAE